LVKTAAFLFCFEYIIVFYGILTLFRFSENEEEIPAAVPLVIRETETGSIGKLVAAVLVVAEEA